MSYLRQKVADVTSKPPPGRYESNTLRVWLHCDTPMHHIVYTRDGSEPTEDSERDHGFRCEHYLPLRGIELKGGGKHVLTIVARRTGFVPTRPCQLVFKLDGPPEGPRRLRGTDFNIQREFDAMVRHTPLVGCRPTKKERDGMLSTSTAFEGIPPIQCLLRDTCSKQRLQEVARDGSDVRMYKVKYTASAVSRSLVFERVATPSVHMTMPILPTGTLWGGDSSVHHRAQSSLSQQRSAHNHREELSVDLRMDASRCMTPTVYETSQLLGSPPAAQSAWGHHVDHAATQEAWQLVTVDGGLQPAAASSPRAQPSAGHLVTLPLATTAMRPLSQLQSRPVDTAVWDLARPGSPACHIPFQNSSIVIEPDSRSAVLPRIVNDASQRRAASQRRMREVATELSLFELKHGVACIRPSGAVQEAVDKAEEESYVAACEALVSNEYQRRGAVSKMFQKLAVAQRASGGGAGGKSAAAKGSSAPPPVELADIAVASREALSMFAIAESIAKTAFIRSLVANLPYADIHRKLNGYLHVTAQELVTLLPLTPPFSAPEIHAALSSIAIRSSEAVRFPARFLLNVLRYLAMLSASAAEAPVFLFLQFWKMSTDTSTEGPVTKTAFLAAMDAYRTTRGADPVTLQQLQSVFYQKLEWGRDDTVPVAKLEAAIQQHCPALDAAIARLSNLDAPMYRR